MLNSHLVAVGLGTGVIQIVDIVKNKCVDGLTGHESIVFSLVKLGDHTLVSGSYDKTIRFWDIQSLKCTKIIKSNEHPFLFSMTKLTETLIAFASPTHLCVMNAKGVMMDSIPVTMPPENIWALAGLNYFCASACGPTSDTICVRNIVTKSKMIICGHTSPVRALTVLDDLSLASGSDDTTIRIWDIKNKLCSAIFKGHTR